jgi:Tropinone reductase 1
VGSNIHKTTTEYTTEGFSFLMSTNLESAYHMSQLAYPLLRASGAGSIVFVSSVASVVAVNIGNSIYSAAKGNFILLLIFRYA